MNTSVAGNSTLISSFTEHLPYVQDVLYTAAVSITFILGLPTNVYVLWLIVTGAGGTMASDIFSLNLAVSEIFYSLSNLMYLIRYHNQHNGALLSAGAFFAGFNLFGRPLFQCCICVERYLAVLHPVTFLKYKPLRYRVGCCAVVWLTVLGFCFANMFGEYQYLWWECFDLILNVLMLSVMLFCCLAVLWALKRPGPGEGEREGEGMNNMKLRAFRIISMIMVSMVVNYLPLVLLLVSYNFIELVEFWEGWSICFSITVVSGFVQPLLHLHRSGKLPCVREP